MRYENLLLGDKKRKEAIEAILKDQNLSKTTFDNTGVKLQKPIAKNDEVPNSEMEVLLSFTEDAFEELEEANFTVQQANKKLDAQNKIIEAYSKQQEVKIEELKFAYSQLEHFAQVGSHDLKEPLRNIANFSQLLIKHCAKNIGVEGQNFLEVILQGVNQLDTTLNHFIDYLQIENQFKGAEIVDLNKLVEDIDSDLKSQLGQNSFQLKVEQLPEIAVNQPLFKRLMKELMVNAIKFKHTELPKIEISCNKLDEEFWLFKVKDNGVGLDEQLIDKLFLPFQRTGKNSLYEENRPMGLAVCQKIVKLHRGDIWYNSTAVPNEGTTFLFTIRNIAGLSFEKDNPETDDHYMIPN